VIITDGDVEEFERRYKTLSETDPLYIPLDALHRCILDGDQLIQSIREYESLRELPVGSAERLASARKVITALYAEHA
jgi:hypothetical protein